MPPSTDRLLAEVAASTATLAGIVSDCDPGLAVPSCPDWTLRQLGTHAAARSPVGRRDVSTRTAEGVPMKAVPDGRPPVIRPGRPTGCWPEHGALTDAIRAAGTEPVWAFGSLAPATFWAGGRHTRRWCTGPTLSWPPAGRWCLTPSLAADAIDEWLTIMAGPRYGRPDAGPAALPDGASLCVHAIAPDQGGTGSAQWLISAGGGIVVAVRARGRAHRGPDVTVSGPPDQLLLVLLRRIPAATAAMTVTGDATLLTGWLTGTPF